jgi:hypothetical protein
MFDILKFFKPKVGQKTSYNPSSRRAFFRKLGGAAIVATVAPKLIATQKITPENYESTFKANSRPALDGIYCSGVSSGVSGRYYITGMGGFPFSG